MGNLIRSIQINRAKFSHCSFAHIDRKTNRVAHELAPLTHISNCIWMEDIHPNIVPNFLLSLWTSSNIIATFIQKNIKNNDSGGVKLCGYFVWLAFDTFEVQVYTYRYNYLTKKIFGASFDWTKQTKKNFINKKRRNGKDILNKILLFTIYCLFQLLLLGVILAMHK
jgi:hypothetical protein